MWLQAHWFKSQTQERAGPLIQGDRARARVRSTDSMHPQAGVGSNVVNAGKSSKRALSEAESVHGLPCCSKVVDLLISDVLPSDASPRRAGVNATHVRMLTESTTVLPPIVVRRATMQVVDGWHRLQAARLRGETTIAAVFFEGDQAAAFVLAVKQNAAHGLPLSLADRKAAALRILSSYPDWSDRSIAVVAGVSHKTVAAIRKRSAGRIPQSTGRIARNGVLHRSAGPEGRQRAAELFIANPSMSVRKVALAAGISVTTAKDVRKRLRAGEPAAVPGPVRERVPQRTDAPEVLRRLRRDPSLRFNENGRKLLRLLDTPFEDGVNWSTIVRSVPDHCTRSIAELARERALEWQQLADLLDRSTRACDE